MSENAVRLVAYNLLGVLNCVQQLRLAILDDESPDSLFEQADSVMSEFATYSANVAKSLNYDVLTPVIDHPQQWVMELLIDLRNLKAVLSCFKWDPIELPAGLSDEIQPLETRLQKKQQTLYAFASTETAKRLSGSAEDCDLHSHDSKNGQCSDGTPEAESQGPDNSSGQAQAAEVDTKKTDSGGTTKRSVAVGYLKNAGVPQSSAYRMLERFGETISTVDLERLKQIASEKAAKRDRDR